MTTLVGGVGELYQGDLDLGRLAVERLAAEYLGPGVLVEDLHYGALAVSQRLQEVRPQALVLVGAVARGRGPGTVERRRIHADPADPAQAQRAVEEAGTGHVSIDLVVEVASAFRALPERTVAIEVEPALLEPSESLSPAARAGLKEAVELARLEIGRQPLLELTDRLRALLVGDRIERTPALETMRGVLEELTLLDQEGRWGATFRLRDRLRLRIAAGETGEGMDHLDWSQWWGLIEELDRLQSVEGTPLSAARDRDHFR